MWTWIDHTLEDGVGVCDAGEAAPSANENKNGGFGML